MFIESNHEHVFLLTCTQASRKLDEQQLTSLSSEKALNEYLETERDNITNIIKQMLAVGEIFKRENLQVNVPSIRLLIIIIMLRESTCEAHPRHQQSQGE